MPPPVSCATVRRAPMIGAALSVALGLLPQAAARAGDILELSLEQLMSLEVTSVSRKSQRVSEAPAAVFVITADDLRRSGATSIPEALRMVPGLQVARVDANQWAISARGFNGRFANKLQVLMDGRELYSPLYAGVFWDVQDTLLEDIERIEVIRGPGGTLWGANAVNGVINIITKRAAATQGNLLSLTVGTEARGMASYRHGGTLGETGYYRVYGKGFRRDGSVLAGEGSAGDDDAHQGRIGFRADWQLSSRDEASLQSFIYRGGTGLNGIERSPQPPFERFRGEVEDVSGGVLLGHFRRRLSDASEWRLQAYYDRSNRDRALYAEHRDTLDVDFQHRFAPLAGHDLLWGLRYRYTHDHIDGSFGFSIEPESRGDHLWSAFIQDEITLVPERWHLIVGSKLDHNAYSGHEIQPNLRLLWTPNERSSYWGALSRAVTTPTRAFHDGQVNGLFGTVAADRNPTRVPVLSAFTGNQGFDAEEVTVYELGARFQHSAALSLDLATFYSRYRNLRSPVIAMPTCEPAGRAILERPACLRDAVYVAAPVFLENGGEGDSYGFELAGDWRARDWLRLQLAYSFLELDLNVPTRTTFATDFPVSLATGGLGKFDSANNPRHQLSLRASASLSPTLELDGWLRYVDELPLNGIDGYVDLDLRLAWTPRPGLELSLVGQHLFDPQYPEFVSEIQDIRASELERGFYAQLRVVF